MKPTSKWRQEVLIPITTLSYPALRSIKKGAAILLVSICCFVQAKAQNASNFNPKIFRDPPNSAAFNKYGDYAVNMSSGLPTISIPLYEITSGGLKMPITLDYHASGIKITDLASWAGLGWSLNTGGQISRRVMGNPDDNSNGYLSNHRRDAATIFPTTVDGDVTYLNDVRLGIYDTQPDIFSYSYPGRDGKFFLHDRNNFQPTLVPFAPITIKRNFVSGDATTIGSFLVTDEFGNTYDYGSSAIEWTTASNNGVNVQSKSSWMLQNVISQNKRDTININYSSMGFTTPADYSYSTNVDDNIYNADAAYYTSGITENPVAYSSSNIVEEKPTVINFRNGKVVFHLSDADRQDLLTATGVKSLKDIQVFSYDYGLKSYTLLKTIKFYQSYFISGSDPNTNRLRLDSLQILNGTGGVVQRFKFEYNNLALPIYTSLGRDYWGYFNGKTQTSLIPRTTISFQNSSTSFVDSVTIGSNIWNGREPDSVYMQACVLKKIFYPTGGYTLFNYQTNRYIDNGTVKLAGGLRVASILNFDGLSGVPTHLKSYQYASPKVNFKLSNYFFNISKLHRYFPGTNWRSSKTTRTFLSNPSVDVEPWESTPVFYQSVTEYDGNSEQNTGKTIHTFRFVQDQINSAFTNGKPIVSSFFFNRGQELSKSVYKRLSNAAYQIVSREVSNYTAFPVTWYDAGLAVTRALYNDPGDIVFTPGASNTTSDDPNYWHFTNFSIPSDDNYITSKTTYEYDQNDTTKFVTEAANYYYGNIKHQQITRAVHTDSKSNVTVNTQKFPSDYLSLGSSTTGNTVLDKMIALNIIATPVEKWDTLKNTANSTNRVIFGQLSLFSINKGSMGAVVPDKILKLGVTSPLSDFAPSTVTTGQLVYDSRYIQKISFDEYDLKNNLATYTVGVSPPTRIIWDYLNDLPVAELKNSPSVGAYTSFEADGKGKWTYAGNPVTDNTAPSGSLVYNLSAGPITFSALNNTVPYNVYYWSKTGSATVNGSTGTSITVNSEGWTLYRHIIAAGSSAVNINGTVTIDELRMYPDGAQMKTYTYKPLIGISDVTDEKEVTQHYEYDDFQRLSNVKDTHKHIVKNITYNYASNKVLPAQVYLSASVTGSFQRTNCGGNQVGSYVSLTEPYGKFTSTVSQADADQQAQNALAIDGPNNANATGTCMSPFLNSVATHDFQKNNCGVGYPGSTVTYTVPAGTYSSLISQADADQQAQDDITQHGQTYSNTHGTCPSGTDIANWHISAVVPSSTGHTINVTVTRPAGDVNNSNTANFHIPSKSYSGVLTVPVGVTTYTKTITFSSAVGTTSVSIFLDSIN